MSSQKKKWIVYRDGDDGRPREELTFYFPTLSSAVTAARMRDSAEGYTGFWYVDEVKDE